MIYVVKQFENYKYRVNAILKRLKNDNFNDYSGDLQLCDVHWSCNNKNLTAITQKVLK